MSSSIKQTRARTTKIWLPITAFCLGIITFGILEITNVVDLVHTGKSTTSVATQEPAGVKSAAPTNTVDYSPASQDDTVISPEKSTQTSNTTQDQNTDISILITSSRKSGSSYLIKAVISGSTQATCTARMAKGSSVVEANSGATMIENQYSCEGLSMPMSQLAESGTWKLEVTATDKTGSTATDTQEVIL